MNADRESKIHFAFGQGTCLAELDALSLEAISKAAVRHTFNKGEFVCLEGEPCPGLMIVESGWLKGEKVSPQGREQETRLAGPGEMLNEASVMAGGDNLVTIKSLESSVVWLIGREILFDLMAKHPHLSNTITYNLAKHVEYLLNLVEDLALRNVDGRLARLLLERSKDGIIYRHNWSTQAEMAACIGTTPEIISRVLNDLEDRGAIRLEHRRICIVDHQMLESVLYLKYK
jgi:CRP-like cAMP-binding protein